MNKIMFLMVFLLMPCKAFALGSVGHQLVCQLAYDLLSEEKQQQINNLVALMPQAHKKLVNEFQKLPENQKVSFATGCVWPDAVKRISEFQQYNAWHYINLERDKTKVTKQDCLEHCLPRAIEVHNQQLTKYPNSWQRTQALFFLGHWLGDIHQPLHVSFASDLGGNKTKLNDGLGNCTSLHWYWDSCVISQAGLSYEQLLQALTQQMARQDIYKWQGQDQWFWASESLAITRSKAFHYCKLDQEGFCQPLVNEGKRLTLPENYHSMHWPIMSVRIQQAAVRLAELLSQPW